MSARRLTVALLGAGYGRFYLPAVLGSAGLRLVAVLSTGSARSRRVAEVLGVAHHSSVERMLEAERPDLAIVALPSEVAPSAVYTLLRRGVHVLCEHPLRAAVVRRALALGAARGLRFGINAHFADLAAVRRFAALCAERGAPRFGTITCHGRMLYSSLDILRGIVGPFRAPRVLAAVPYRERGLRGGTICVSLAGAIHTFHVYPARPAPDDGTEVPIHHQIALSFASGTALLADTLGPALWLRDWLAPPASASWRLHGAPTALRELGPQRLAANDRALRRFVALVRRPRSPTARAEDARALDVARTYELLARAIELDVP